mgnify:CR=1 FL=1
MNLLKKYYSMSTLEKLDKVDLQILRTLQENARLTTKELAARVSLSSTPVFERLKRLENGGYIKKYIAYNISGSYDYLLKIHSPNMKYYQEFILNVLGTIDSLGSLESTFVMNEVKHEYGIHI